MNKVLPVVLIAGAVLVGGYFYLNGDKGEMVKDTSASQMEKKIAFSQFLKDRGSYECKVDQSVEGAETKGTVYINDGFLRGRFETQTQGTKMATDLLVSNGYTYTWSSAAPMGVKAPVLEDGTIVDKNQELTGSYSWNADQIGEYDCVAWTPDPAVFSIPEGIEFMDVGTMAR